MTALRSMDDDLALLTAPDDRIAEVRCRRVAESLPTA
jgi:hypothetical protein